MTPAYIFICLLNFAIVVWVLVKYVHERQIPPQKDDDDGGIPSGYVFPDFDLPSGSGLDDLLVDRMPKDGLGAPNQPVRRLIEELCEN
ncbi:MAG: hypothetical protein V4714_01520 [Bacteroidota bacterium]